MFVILLLHVHEKLLACQRTTSVQTCTCLISNEVVQHYGRDKQTDGHTHMPYIKKNSVALVRERTIPTERPPPVGEVSANFCG